MKITSREAVVKTASVEVHALTLSDKQITLAVFRQLQAEPLINLATAELNGVVWGRVNYFWGGCSPDHLHAVWQKGVELRRACVSAKPDGWKSGLNVCVARVKSLIRRWVGYRLLESSDSLAKLKEKYVTVGPGKVYASEQEYPSVFSNYDSLKQSTWVFQPPDPVEHNRKFVEAANALRRVLGDGSADEVNKEIEEEQMWALAFIYRWEKSYQTVLSTEQLFIAI
jgi:hypothetical protein